MGLAADDGYDETASFSLHLHSDSFRKLPGFPLVDRDKGSFVWGWPRLGLEEKEEEEEEEGAKTKGGQNVDRS